MSYSFAGTLRPALLTPKREVPEGIARPDYATHEDGTPISEYTNKASNTIVVYSP